MLSKIFDCVNKMRPQLISYEVAKYNMYNYFAKSGLIDNPTNNPWIPTSIKTNIRKPNFIVGSKIDSKFATHHTIQKAINSACKVKNKSKRVFIKILPGIYTDVVYVPMDAPPITIYGSENNVSEVKIQLTIDALYTPAEYAKTVNGANQFKPSDAAWYMYEACATLKSKKIDTSCSAVFWVQSDDFQLKNVTITNTLLDDGDYQAVALRTDGDKTQLENVRLIGRQDTFWVNSGDKALSTNKQGAYSLTKITRAYVKDTYIEGDIDFVMGRANAVFNKCIFKVVSTRNHLGIVFAPNTLFQNPYGFLVMNSILITDSGYNNLESKATLGRS
ncbi:MAG: pectinesterase family protein, partial [Clostridiales bacterium]